MQKISIEEMTQINGSAANASCLGGVLTGLVGGAATGFKAGSYTWTPFGIGWGTAIGAIGGGSYRWISRRLF